MARGIPLICMVMALTLTLPLAATAGTDTHASAARETSLETLVLRKINAVRTAHGLARLTASGGLTQAALTHSRSMVTSGFFAHESRDGAPFWKRLKLFYAPHSRRWTVGENLAMFGGERPDAGAIVSSWLASPPHRANLLSSRFAQAGIAILHDPAAGGVFGGESTWVVTLDVGTR
jgi:uncharacterized protein YkwD